MKNKIWRVIGVMSGTSLDGTDLVFVKISKNNSYSFELLNAETYPYSDKWKNSLTKAFYFTGEELTKVDVEYGAYLAKTINDFIVKNELRNIDFIASHGHTIFHQPQENYTLQIGNGAVIQANTNIKTICNFRVQDVALGGQGAPLVPIGDKLFFSKYTFCLNLGGFSNISFDKNKKRIAFDICPVNIVLNHYTKKIGLEYDDKGKIASKGKIIETLLNELNNLPFYKSNKPKSLGYEFVMDQIFPLIDKYKAEVKDILKTFIEHITIQIASVVNAHSNYTEKNNLMIAGGGAFNQYLIERLKTHTKLNVIIPKKNIINYKEAVVFALLGVLKEEGKINCLGSVTGAKKDHSSGVIYSN